MLVVRQDAHLSFSSIPKSQLTMSMAVSDRFRFDSSGIRSRRVTRVYNTQERQVIDAFKDSYMQASTPAVRTWIAKNQIWPAIFKYWTDNGDVIDDSELQKRTVVSLSMQSELISKIHLFSNL